MEECRISSYGNKSRNLFVDADACPVKQEIVEISEKYAIHVVFVASHAHMTDQFPNCDWKYVDSNKEEVDFYILNHAQKDDVAVTQDIGLASMLLAKGVHVLTVRGKELDERFISTALHMRYLAAKKRRRGIYGKGPKPFTQSDKDKFKKQLLKTLSKIEGI